MPITVTIDVTGVTPVYVYLCDVTLTTCIYIDSVSTFPYQFDIPQPFDDQTSYKVKIQDSDGCEKIETITI